MRPTPFCRSSAPSPTPAGIDVETSDISVAARILAEFSDYLTEEQRVPDNLAELGELTQLTRTPTSSSCRTSAPRCRSCWPPSRSCKAKGYDLPDYPGEPKTDEEKEIKERYGQVLGSAVNPVLREGNSDRRAPKAVKEYARKHPHSMGEWSQASRTHVATMKRGDFYHGEKSMTLDKDAHGAGWSWRPRAARRSCSSPRWRWTTATSSTACS